MIGVRDLLYVAVAIGISIYAWYYVKSNRDDLSKIPVLEYSSDPALAYGHEPKICTGFDKKADKQHGIAGDLCPPNYAYFLNYDRGIRNKSIKAGRVVSLAGPCCPLPADDILTDEHVYDAVESCPFNYVATGGTGNLGCGKSCTMRCTKINTDRYKLGEERMAMYWKRNLKQTSSGRGSADQIKWHHLPLALRYAAGRERKYPVLDLGIPPWANDGCVGVPFGSLLTKKTTYTCDGFFYRPLLFKDGSAVKMLPECRQITNLLSASKPAVCVPVISENTLP